MAFTRTFISETMPSHCKYILAMLMVLGFRGAFAQGEIKIFGEQSDQGIFLYANNIAPCPVSVKLELELNNMKAVVALPEFYVIPASTERFPLVELKVIDVKQRLGYKSRFEYVLGDVGLQSPDNSYVYDLPFEKKNRFMIFQGYNGIFSHQNQSALDFVMPEGTTVLASREGIVVKVEESNSKSCPEKECGQFNNLVLVYHSDGSFAEYTHLRKDGAKVSLGDRLKKGDVVGYSGSTGWTSGPHLHFVCFLSRLGSRASFPTKFRTGDGSITETLEEKATYSREY